jgi:Zn ribbon nucleic-acid-binding protein
VAEFPESLDIAINSLINTLVYKIITRESTNAEPGGVSDVEEFIQLTGIPAATDVAIRNYATQKAKEIWGPYRELPPPSSFDAPIRALANARHRLTNTGVTQLQEAEAFSLSALVPDYMQNFRINQSGWRGETIDAIRSKYLARWGGMVFLQANTLALLELVLAGYQEQVAQAQKDVVALVNAAEQVIAAYDPGSMCGSTDSKNLTFNILIGVATVVSAAAGGAGLAVTSIVAAAAAGGLGIAKDAYNPAAPMDAEIQGHNVAAIWRSILDATDRLRQQFEASDRELHDIVAQFHQGVINSRITVGKSGEGEQQTVPALELIRSSPLGSTTKVNRPLVGSANPDPAHSPHY